MARTKKIAAAKEKGHDGHIPKIYAYGAKPSVAPTIDEVYTTRKWVSFGKRNDYPERLLDLMINNAVLGRCHSLLSTLIAGRGIKFYDRQGEHIEEASAMFDEMMDGTTQEEFLYATSSDISFLNAFSWVPRRSATSDIVKLDHLDVSRLRCEPLDEKGDIPGYYWSASWKNYTSNKRFEPIQKRAFDFNKKSSSGVIYAKPYTIGHDLYARPWWTGCIKAVELWNMIDTYDQTEIETGFSGSVHLHTYTNKPEEQLKDYDKKVQLAYAGEHGRALFHTYGTPGEGAPMITHIPKGDRAGSLNEISARCEMTIAKAYGIPLPLIGLDFKTGMDGAGAALVQATDQLMKMLVLPKQQMILAILVRLMSERMPEIWEGRFEQIELLDDGIGQAALGAAYLASVTKNEHRTQVLGMTEVADGTGGEYLNHKAATPKTADPNIDPNTPEE